MNTRRTDYILALCIPLLFVVIALFRLYPFHNTLQQIVNDSGNDWSKYAANALDIKHNGILLPAVDGAYEKPASFFYSYFLALCFYLFGDNNLPVYILQNLMLGLSIIFVWLTFRERMSKPVSYGFLFALVVFGITDVSMYYTFRFLGENLALFALSVFFLLFLNGIEKNKMPELFASAVFLGMAVLTRPNIFLFAVLLIILLVVHIIKTQKVKPFAIFISVLVITSSFLAIRNYFICHCIQQMPSQGMLFNMIAFHPIPASVDISSANNYYAAYVQYLLQEPGMFITHYLKKIAFCFGFMNAVVPSYHWFPHWTLMWLGYFTYLFFLFRNKIKTTLHEKATHIFILTYFASLVLVGQIENYGFRMLIPGNFFVLAFAFLAFDKLLPLLKKKSVLSP